MTFLHFSRAEFSERQRALCGKLADEGLDGIVLFRQESMYYLTGYDTAGYTMFQALYFGRDGHYALLTRPIDLIQAQLTSIIDDIRVWRDGANTSPGVDLRNVLSDYGAKGGQIGIEYHAYGLTGHRSKMVERALEGFCTLSDASDLVRSIQLVKSPAELAYVRKAGVLCDRIYDVCVEQCGPGKSVKAICGSMLAALMEEGGDLSASRWPAGAGQAALFGRYHTGDEFIGNADSVVFEPGAAFRHYNACTMYNVIIGQPTPEQIKMNEACARALDACQSALVPGKTLGEVFEAYAESIRLAGYSTNIMSACGYTMGAMYPPTWMDFPMIWKDNPQVITAGMVYFIHVTLFVKETGNSMCIGETSVVTETGSDKINNIPRAPIVIF